MPSSPPKADWMSFVLHFLFGLGVGCVIGFGAISEEGFGAWLDEDLGFTLVSGITLFCGGLGAKLGDSLWMSSSESVVHSDAPAHSRLSEWLCRLSILIGIALVATSLFKQFYG